MKNCIVRTLKDERTVYWTGVGWLEDRERAFKMSLCDAENHVDNMRNADEMAYWERYDKDRTAL